MGAVIVKGAKTTIAERKRRRGVVYSVNMDLILVWLLGEDERIRTEGSTEERAILLLKGIPWGLQLLLRDERNNFLLKKGSKRVSSSAVSSSLAKLASQRNVKLYKGSGTRTTHVTLTEAGRARALYKKAHPEHWSELREQEPAKYGQYKLKTWRRKNG